MDGTEQEKFGRVVGCRSPRLGQFAFQRWEATVGLTRGGSEKFAQARTSTGCAAQKLSGFILIQRPLLGWGNWSCRQKARLRAMTHLIVPGPLLFQGKSLCY
jgi:hypothetical protein